MLFNGLFAQITNQPITWQQLTAWRLVEAVQDDSLRFKLSIRTVKSRDGGDFERGERARRRLI